MRDRLIELIDKAKEEYAKDITDHTETDYIVECLLNNGVRLSAELQKAEQALAERSGDNA